MSPQAQIATMVDWASAPRWLSIEVACFLSGHDRLAILDIIDADGVDLNDEGQTEKESL